MSFFGRVLPALGPFSLFTGAAGPGGKLIEPRHWNGIKTHAELEKEVQRLSMLPLNVFYCSGSFAGTNRRDPVAKRAFWLDLDGKDFSGTENALRELSAFVRATGLPPPSIYVNSGHGLHVFWCLDRDLPVAEWKPIASALKNKCNELNFKADPTATADPARVLRAPGSLNRKDETPVPCRVLADNGSVYSPEQIAAALHPASRLSGSLAKLAARVSNEDLSTRKHNVERTADDVRAMLSHIDLPEQSSRDRWISVLCAVQAWSDKSDEGFAIFHDWSATQPNYVSEEDCLTTWNSFEPGGGIGIGTLVKLARDAGWSDSTIPVGVTVDANSPLADQMAAAQMTASQAPNSAAPIPQSSGCYASPLQVSMLNALAALSVPRLPYQEAKQWLGAEFVMIKDQVGLYFSLTERVIMMKESIDDMLTRWMPMRTKDAPYTATQILRREGTRNTVESLGFFPGMPMLYCEGGKWFVNLYSEPPAMIVPTPAESALVADIWDYTFPLPADKPFGTYLLQFYAHIVQQPAVKLTSAPLMVSEEFGTGKTTVMYNIPRALVGISNARHVSNKVLRSQFSDYITGAQFLHFDEIHINGKWDSDDTANSLKNLVTGIDVEVHPKGLKPYNIPNRIFITATSNYEDAITLPTHGERRWGIYYLEPTRGWTPVQTQAYFKSFHGWLNGPRGPGVLRYIFSQIDISGFNPCAPPPVTESKITMVEKSQASEVQILIDAAKHNDWPFDRELFTAEEVGQFLHTQTGKTYASLSVKGYLDRTLPDAKIIRQIRVGTTRLRAWALKDHKKWEDAGADEIREALKNRG